MLKIFKKKRAVSPVVAVILLVGLTLAAASIVFLVVLPMLNPDLDPILIPTPGSESFVDFDNDGNCDYMRLQVDSMEGGADAQFTQIIVAGTIGGNAYETSWKPLTNESSSIGIGEKKYLQFIASTDNVDEISNGASVIITIVSNEAATSILEIDNPITVTTGDPVRVEFVDGNDVPIVGGQINFYRDTGEFAYVGELTGVNGISVTYLFPGSYYVRASDGFSLFYSDPFVHPGEGLIHVAIQGGVLTVMVKAGTSPIEGARAYVYDTNGRYLGKKGITGADGIVTFSLENGLYKIRADVISITYYSEDIDFPSTSYVEIDTGGGDIYCRVIDGGSNPIPNVRVYLFRASGSYFGKRAYTNTSGLAFFSAVPGGTNFKFRVDYLAYRLWSQEFGASPGAVIDVNVGGGTVYVNVTDGSGFPIVSVRTYLFTQYGSYTGKNAYTNASGIATYTNVAGGWFKFRFDYLAQRFWSPVFNATDGLVVQASIGGGTLFGNITSGGNPVVNVRVYLFTEYGSYTGKNAYTNTSGIIEIQGVGESSYRMRVDYTARRYWSPTFFFNETQVVDFDIGGGIVYANVTTSGTPISGVRVYVFTSSGSYTGRNAYTNTSGIAEFTSLGGGDFKFRVDYLARRFWSDVFTVSNNLVIDMNLGGGTIYVHLLNNYNYDISGVRIYLFTEYGSYTGKNAYTNASGIAEFAGIGEANYKFRVDYLANRYWSTVFLASPDLNFEFNIGGGIVYLHVFDGSGTDIANVRTYLFTSSGSYSGFNVYLNSTGYLNCSRIGDGTFKWRFDYLGKRFWSPDFVAVNESVLEFNIGGGTIFVHLTVDGVDVDNGRVYLFTSTGSYTGKNLYTNSTGWAVFYGIGDGDYRFRYRHSGTYYYEYFTAQADLEVEFAILTSMLPLSITSDAPKRKEILIPSL